MNFGFPNGIAIKPSAARDQSNKSSPDNESPFSKYFPYKH